MTNPAQGVPFRIYNTLGREIQEFRPEDPELVRMYTCGPTVYAYAHLGNMRAYVCADLLRRALEWKGYGVCQLMNITDVGHMTSDDDLSVAVGEDKLEAASRREGRTVWDVAEHYTWAFQRDLGLLNIQPPSLWAKATDHIPEMIEFAKRLQGQRVAYEIPSGLYFDVSTVPNYGRLALLDTEGLREGARVSVAEGKRNPRDFALWRRSAPDSNRLMEWESPWGPGVPGWHLECSVMSIKYLGEHFDVHTGGIDHVPIHHTNEIAQSEAFLDDGRPWVRYWFHNEFLVLGDAKVSKSRGDTIRLGTLAEEGFPASVYRYFLLNTHYRSPATFSMSALASARTALGRLIERLQPADGPTLECTYAEAYGELAGSPGLRYLLQLDTAISDDLNTAQALAVLHAVSHDECLTETDVAALVGAAQRLLGLDLSGTSLGEMKTELRLKDIPEEVRLLLDEREAARARRDFVRADAIRDEIARMGLTVEDTSEGPRLVRHASRRDWARQHSPAPPG